MTISTFHHRMEILSRTSKRNSLAKLIEPCVTSAFTSLGFPIPFHETRLTGLRINLRKEDLSFCPVRLGPEKVE
jgi:hypothetical protein